MQLQENTFVNISSLIELLLTVSPSTAACERSFSSMNHIKTPYRSTLSQDNLQNQMRIVLSGPSLQDYDASDSVDYWLNSCKGGRHLFHQPKIVHPSTSTGAELNLEQFDPNFVSLVMDKIGDSKARIQLKKVLADSQCLFQ